MDDVTREHPDVASIISIGETYEGRDTRLLKVMSMTRITLSMTRITLSMTRITLTFVRKYHVQTPINVRAIFSDRLVL